MSTVKSVTRFPSPAQHPIQQLLPLRPSPSTLAPFSLVICPCGEPINIVFKPTPKQSEVKITHSDDCRARAALAGLGGGGGRETFSGRWDLAPLCTHTHTHSQTHTYRANSAKASEHKQFLTLSGPRHMLMPAPAPASWLRMCVPVCVSVLVYVRVCACAKRACASALSAAHGLSSQP